MFKVISIFTLLFIAVYSSDLPQQCGRSVLETPDWRIINGQDAQLGEFPWQVLLTLEADHGDNFCGATLISDQWVLTAAHCIYSTKLKASDLLVRLGVYNMSVVEKSEIDVEVDEIIIHEKALNFYDIALLRLKDKIDFNAHKNVYPVCLTRNMSKVDTNKCVTTGFGCTTKARHPPNGILQKVDNPIVDDSRCLRAYPEEWFPNINLCATGTKDNVPRSFCRGDSGGPLICMGDDKRWYQLGITSHGADPDSSPIKDPELLDIFTKVTAFMDWIELKILLE